MRTREEIKCQELSTIPFKHIMCGDEVQLIMAPIVIYVNEMNTL